MVKVKSLKYFPADYQGYNILNVFKKDNARTGRAFVTNDPDEWFVDVLYYNLKDGKVKEIETIIAKDIPYWITWFKNLGWNEEK